MFRNYLKLTVRNLWRNKVFSAINVLGLSIGIAICLLIMLFIRHEWSYDRYNDKAARIVRVVFKGSVHGDAMKEANVMPPTAQILLNTFPEIEASTRIRRSQLILRLGENSAQENQFAYADPNFFQVFTVPLLKGDINTVLREPNTVAISRATAQKYFGDADPVGKTLQTTDGQHTFTVTGVFDKIPDNSHFHFELLASTTGLPEARSQNWMESGFFTYLLLKAGTDYKKLEVKLPGIVEQYMAPQLMATMGFTLQEFRKQGNDIGLFLQPLTSIHLHSDLNPLTEIEPAGDIRYVYIFGAVAFFMLLIACINFMNLSTASASKRAREVGVRKALGSDKLALIQQFLMESLLLTAIALVIGIAIVYLTLPVFNDLTGKHLSLGLFSNPWVLPSLLLFGLCTGIFAGSYPAFLLSSFSAAKVLKGSTINPKSGGLTFRSGLVIFQFFISIILIVGTLVVYRQLIFIQHKKLGYNKDQVIVIPQTWLLGANEETFMQNLLHDTRVMNVSSSGYLPAGDTYSNNFFIYRQDKAEQVKTLRYDVDYNYIPTMGMEIIQGRNFSRNFGMDSSGVILNETAAKSLGFEQNALGQIIHRSKAASDGDLADYHVIGIVKDFHFRSMHERISPLVMRLTLHSGAMIVKAKTRDVAGLVASMQQQWQSLKASQPFSYSFLDERFKATYQAEVKIGRTLGIFSGLTIFIACLGLFGLATFTAEQRTKEIGVRKVMGANVANIVGLLSKDFLKLVLVANIIALPLAWYVMHLWLQDFQYHTSIQWWMFLMATLTAVIIALVAVGYQSVKAALANPVKSLRNP